MTAPRQLFRSQMADSISPVGHSLMNLHIEDTVKENTEGDTAKGSFCFFGLISAHLEVFTQW